MKFKKIIIGGTFDLLHVGHSQLILKAFKLAKFVSIGITSDKFNKKRGKVTFEKQALRRKNLNSFLKKKNLLERSSQVFINDIFGTSLTDPGVEAIVITYENLKNAKVVNSERLKKGLKKLRIIVLPHLKDRSGKVISSSRIRSGEISKEGEIYKDFLIKIADKKLDKKILGKFKKPLGKIVKSAELNLNAWIITVGDITSHKVLSLNISPKLSVIDLKVMRVPVFNWIRPRRMTSRLVKVPSRPGTISKKLILKIEKSLRNRKNGQIILVDGEEDLATIPSILLSPLGTIVLYGQPGKGMVQVIVNQKIKDRILGFF